MKEAVRNIIAVLAGFVLGSAVNMSVIMAGPRVVPPPAGVDMSNMDSIKASIHLFQPVHFAVPLLAHALGTFVGALVAYCVASTHRARIAYSLGLFMMLGGAAAAFMIPAPTWFLTLDLLGAYMPMAWLGTRVGAKFVSGRAPDTAGARTKSD